MPVSADKDGPSVALVAVPLLRFLYDSRELAWTCRELSDELDLNVHSVNYSATLYWRAGVLRRFKHRSERGIYEYHYVWDIDLTAEDVISTHPQANPEFGAQDEHAMKIRERLKRKS